MFVSVQNDFWIWIIIAISIPKKLLLMQKDTMNQTYLNDFNDRVTVSHNGRKEMSLSIKYYLTLILHRKTFTV